MNEISHLKIAIPKNLADRFCGMAITTLRLSNILCDQSPKNESSVLGISIRTWTRDSHDLFDYEAAQVTSDTVRITGQSVELLRKGNDVIAISSEDPIHLDSEYLVSVRFDKLSGKYVVSSRDSPYLHPGVGGRKLWSVIRENNPQGCRLQEGDIVKLGRFRLRVRQICLSEKLSEDDNTSCSSYDCQEQYSIRRKDSRMFTSKPDLRIGNHSPSLQFAPCFDLESAANNPALLQLQCRICLSEGPQEGDPLLCPCECSGSIGYVHSDCIGRWLRGRLGLENHTKGAYFYRPMACELCHATYPPYWRRSSISHNSVTSVDESNHVAFLPETRPPFIVFENIGGSPAAPAWTSDSSNTFPYGLHIVSLSNPAGVKIGRGHDCEMRISDVSISRQHALIKLGEDGNVYISDHQSKFGTLVALDRDDKTFMISHASTSSVSIQCGRTVLSFSNLSPEVASTPIGDTNSIHSTYNDGSDFNDEFEDADIADDLEFQS
jgi:hypothetical protein